MSLTRLCWFSHYGLIYIEKTLECGAERKVGKEWKKKEGELDLCCSLASGSF